MRKKHLRVVGDHDRSKEVSHHSDAVPPAEEGTPAWVEDG